MSLIRKAEPLDIQGICDCDPILVLIPERAESVKEFIGRGECHVYVRDNVVGYCIFNHSFFGFGFINVFMIHPDFRRKGIGTELLRYVESQCTAEKLFTTAHIANHEIDQFLSRSGYQRSGVIENLNDDRTELVFVKRLKQQRLSA